MVSGIFDDFKILVIQSDSLGTDTVARIRNQLSEETKVDLGSFLEVKNATGREGRMNDQELSKITHIISSTISFPEYTTASDKLMIPVVTPDWFFESMSQGKLQSVRSYSADPTLVFKGCMITCSTSICEDDRKLLASAVKSFGGIFVRDISRKLTHLITENEKDDDRYEIVKEFNRRSGSETINIVSPDWVLGSIGYGRRLDEAREITLPSGTSSASFLGDKTLYLSSDYGVSNHVRESLTSIVSAVSGGRFVTELKDANCYLGPFREGDEFDEASESPDVTIGNLDWLFWMLLKRRWTSPLDKLLHYPIPKTPVEGMDENIASATNYTGDARLYLQRLVEAMGGSFTKTLRDTNTHLLVAKAVGKKYEAAKRWDVKCVNHLWLEDSYAHWKLQPDDDPKYCSYPRDSDSVKIIGTTTLDANVLDRKEKAAVKGTASAVTIISGKASPGTNNSANSDASIDSTISRKRESSADTSEEQVRKQIKHSTKPYDIVAIMTGCDTDLTSADRKNLHRVGIKIVDIPTKSLNCIIAPTILRTEKFMKSLSMSPKYIISPLFISDVLGTLDTYPKVSEFDSVKPEISKYGLGSNISFDKDHKVRDLFLHPELGEKRVIENLIERSNARLFEGLVFNISSKTPGEGLVSDIIKHFGAEDCQKVDMKTKKFRSSGSGLYDNVYILLCSPEEKSLVGNFKKIINRDQKTSDYLIVEWDWVVHCIYNTCLDEDRFVIEKNLSVK
ncbi:DEKNAAC104505 [Brettanomyces naardenensis]|uniref:DEKNAAC104505 n=1 Tax=Brettanomyces naardenensis TaxID=13370 RepID=A0A448YR03_BRENA|nr:DEKNAAC104505 [Brettanomyces naardenensis]